MSDKYSEIVIIGPGRVGKTLAGVLCNAGLKPAAIGVRNPDSVQDFVDKYSLTATSLAQAALAGDVVFLCVNDDAIADICENLAQEGAFSHKPLVVHCSGAVGSEVLSTAAEVGCEVASFHPLQTFPDFQTGMEKWSGTYCFVESPSPKAKEFLKKLAADTGAYGIDIEPQAKALYHAAAVVCCNYLTALMDVGFEMYGMAGIDKAQAAQAISPIIHATMENILAKGPTGALTGPISRGDIATVEKHLQAIDNDEIKQVYKIMGLRTADIALRKIGSDVKTRENIHRIQKILGG